MSLSVLKTKTVIFGSTALAAALLTAGLMTNPVAADESKGNAADAVSGALGNKASDILQDPDKWVGKTVTLKNAEIEEVVSDRAFIVQSGALGTGKGLLVVSRTKFPAAANLPGGNFQKDNDVAITGVVQMYSASEFKGQTGWEMEKKWSDVFEKKPVLVASEVMLLEKE